MDKYFILNLNNNIYASDDDATFKDVLDSNDMVINKRRDAYIIGREVDGVMYDFFTNEEIVYIPLNKSSKVPYLSYYNKRVISSSLMALILSKYKKINVIKYARCIYDIKKRNMLLYGLKIKNDDRVCLIEEYSNPMSYINDFKRKIKELDYFKNR